VRFAAALLLAVAATTSAAGCAHRRATVLYVTDAHEIAPVVDRHGDRGGVARLKTVVDRRRAVDPRALLVFGGDLAGGTLFGGVFRGEPMVDALGRVGVGLAAFGQHDFDFGAAHARRLVERATFPYLTSNLVDPAGTPFAGLPTRRLLAVGGLRVGFLGLTDDLITTTQEGSLVETDLVAAAARETAALRREGAEAVVALTQTGFETNRRILDAVPAIDAILTEEESETTSVVRRVDGRPIASPRGNIGSVAVLVLERLGGRIETRVVFDDVEPPVTPDSALAKEERAWMAKLDERLAAPVGAVSAELDSEGSLVGETALGDLVADAFRAASGADVALVLGSSLRAPLRAGRLTRRDVVAVQPFGNRVVTVEMAGAALRATLERGLSASTRPGGSLLQVAGLACAIDLQRPDGSRLVTVTVGSAPLRDDALFRVATSSHLASGGDGFVELARARRVPTPGGEPLDADALAAHLTRLSGAGPAPVPEGGRLSLSR